MTKFEMNALCEVLEAEAAALRSAFQNWGEIKSEDREPLSLAGRKEFALILFERGSRRLRDINAALQRMEDGCFGDCVDCGQPIPDKRLTAIPWASRCVGCQDTSEAAPVIEKEKIHETTSFRKRSPHAERPRSLVRGAYSSGV